MKYEIIQVNPEDKYLEDVKDLLVELEENSFCAKIAHMSNYRKIIM